MTPLGLMITFFLFTLAAVGAAGYVFVLRPSQAEGELPAQMALGQNDLPGAGAAVLRMFRLIGEAVPRSQRREADTRASLAAAGYRWPAAVSVFIGIKCGSALMLAAVCAWAAVTFQPDSAIAFVAVLAGSAFGYVLPDRVLDHLARQRVQQLRRALPAALDLMVLALEAGQGLNAAILEASRGLRMSHPELASEFTQLYLELQTDPSRLEALQSFATRGRDVELRKFVSLLIDTDRFGVSLGPALRAHARHLRTRFRQAAQERARKVSIKLIFPVFFLIFPSVLLVTLGPAVILLMRQMHALLAG